MVLRRVNTTAVRHANDQWACQPAARAVTHAYHVAAELVEGGINEPHELDFGHRLQPLRGHANRHARDHALREGGILAAILAELLLQPRGRAEDAAVDANIL